MNTLEYICGITFAPFQGSGAFASEQSKESLRLMRERTGANFVIFAPNGLQDTAQSEEICFTSKATVSDEELIEMIQYAKELGMRVAIKPTANCKNGTWRAFINFFDEEVPCEPKWRNWFASYTAFQLHFAKIAQEQNCEMFIAGCEMVMSERREAEWRQLIADIKTVYHGPVSYNTDKYQEHNVTWWDCVDVISSSGYYPIDDWESQLDRIEAVVKKFDKPFFFAETGCMSVESSKYVPNNWEIKGESDLEGQAEWYEAMFSACKKRDWMRGTALWSWGSKLYKEKDIDKNMNYELYAKPAEKVVEKYYRGL